MEIRVKYGNKWIKVSVAFENCNNFTCFNPGKYEHRIRSIDGKPMNWTNPHYSCLNNEYHGCPDNPKTKESK